ncbi:hypothetical protein BKK79_33030 [Cupriavidus sp. USMAA2-4]|nr:hypothetical protein BKK79_33030 [Cupriavidus sp. USMAA2-4]AOZ03201.1 hypothetical protein BKK81_29245 [Cupriavidus sp. USMAHM13]
MCLATSTQYVKMYTTVILNIFRANWRCSVIESPVSRFPIVQASISQLRKGLEHSSSRRSYQVRPLRELFWRKFASFPYRSRRMNEEVAAIGSITKDGVGEGDIATREREEI